jgi:hypothetical protein
MDGVELDMEKLCWCKDMFLASGVIYEKRRLARSVEIYLSI